MPDDIDEIVTAILLRPRIKFLAMTGRCSQEQFVQILQNAGFSDRDIGAQCAALVREGSLHLGIDWSLDGIPYSYVTWGTPPLSARVRLLNERLARIRAADGAA
jgi:hypothetical protein